MTLFAIVFLCFGVPTAFRYSEGDHNVVKVDGKGFGACATSPNSGVLTSGSDKITLTTAGNKWYICGVSGHCDAGQKLKITVLPKSMIGSAPSPAPEAALPGWPWAPAPVATPGYLPKWEMDGVPIPAPEPAVPWFPWPPAPVETPGYMPKEEEPSQGVPTMPPEEGVPPIRSSPAMPPMPWMPVPAGAP